MLYALTGLSHPICYSPFPFQIMFGILMVLKFFWRLINFIQEELRKIIFRLQDIEVDIAWFFTSVPSIFKGFFFKVFNFFWFNKHSYTDNIHIFHLLIS